MHECCMHASPSGPLTSSFCPRCPTMAVSTMASSGSAASARIAGAARLKMIPSCGEDTKALTIACARDNRLLATELGLGLGVRWGGSTAAV